MKFLSAKQRSSDSEIDLIPLVDMPSNAGPASPTGENMPGSSRLFGIFRRKQSDMRHRLIFIPDQPDRSMFPPNVVRNQKYSVWSFFPKVLYEQFKFFFNMYFLLVALSQFIPSLKIGYLFTYLAPLCFVLAVTLGKEAHDDYQRYKRDKEANGQVYSKLTREGIFNVPSSEIKVGDLIFIQKNCRVPADCILLKTTEANGACFIRTDQLDGETDWKLRLAVGHSQKTSSDSEILSMKAHVQIEHPVKDIYHFIGNINWLNSSEQVEALNVENTLWANTVVASGTALGLVIYTGKDTRAVMNTSFPGTKVGLLDLEINTQAKILALVTFALSLTMVALEGFRGAWYINAFRFLILFSSIIPISLRVNLDMGKTVYSHLIMNDDRISNTIVRTSTIPEELGRIQYILTDKTGTLTRNEMELKKLHMGTLAYGRDAMDELVSHLNYAFKQKNDETAHFKQKRVKDIGSRIHDLVMALVLCHNVTPTAEISGISYQASSPDEIAIVKWTESVKVRLLERTLNKMKIATPDGRELWFDILNIFPFTSESKRMGIIVRDCQTGEYIFYQKGADVIMSRLVQANDWLDEECGNMAGQGLRTLVIARKRLSPDSYERFLNEFKVAKSSMTDRATAIQSVMSKYLEVDLELLGLTGVEDKLQEDVKPTLETLRQAGIKIWMLTGDKVETATCIAISSKLVNRHQSFIKMQKIKDPNVALDELDALTHQPDACLVIDGDTLQTCIDHFSDTFIQVACKLPVVVACRCSPTQKALVTRLLKEHIGKRTLAIGDGGNDVSMIQAAHVGVGIVGKEGMQASLAADFSLVQFSHLARLVLWHGRNSYKRSAKLSSFVIHRGLIISIIQAIFSAMFYFAPIALYQGALMVGYATIFTMAPVFSLVLDKDVNEEMALIYPELYKDLVKGRALSLKTFLIWLLISIYQGGAIMFLAILLFEDDFINIVSISFTSLVFNELLMVALEIKTWHRYMAYSLIVTVLIYLFSMVILTDYFDISFILSLAFVGRVALITAVSSVPLYIFKYIQYKLDPPSYRKLEH